MKKKIILTILVVISIFLIAGCNSNKPNENEGKNGNTNVENGNNTTNDVQLYSDDSKYVFEYDNTKHVFYYSGDTITAYHTYVKYDTEELAGYAYKLLKIEDFPNATKYYQNGKYIVFEWKSEEYNNMTASEIKIAYSYMKELKK
jgi:hypothetical protein